MVGKVGGRVVNTAVGPVQAVGGVLSGDLKTVEKGLARTVVGTVGIVKTVGGAVVGGVTGVVRGASNAMNDSSEDRRP